MSVTETPTATFVIVITERTDKISADNPMEHRGVRYAVRIGFEKEQWRVAIFPPGSRLPTERTVFGTREDAETQARSMINVWLRKRPVEEDSGVK